MKNKINKEDLAEIKRLKKIKNKFINESKIIKK